MKYLYAFLTSFLIFVSVVILTNEEPLVPAMFIFGDSVVDIGNNNHIPGILKANFPPYGRDFENHIPTGRFCNGKLILDYFVEILGFTSYPPAYLKLDTKEKNLLIGANFASAGSGYLDYTAKIFNTITMTRQLEYYKECQNELIKIAGQSNASSIISGAIHVVATGPDDFLLNYYQNPALQMVYTPDQFSDILIQKFSKFIQNLYALGARKIAVLTLTAIGCLPIAITLFGSHNNGCVAEINNVAINFNEKLNSTSQNLRKIFPSLNLVLIESYQPLHDLVSKPSEYGFFESRKACCGAGVLEVSILCNQKSIGTCANASGYVFWDSFHLSETANKFLAVPLLSPGIGLLIP